MLTEIYLSLIERRSWAEGYSWRQDPLAHHSGLTTLIPKLLCMTGKVKFDLRGTLSGGSFVAHLLSLLIKLSVKWVEHKNDSDLPGATPAQKCAESLIVHLVLYHSVIPEVSRDHFLVMICDFALQQYMMNHEAPYRESRAILHMLCAAHRSLDAGEVNCGAYIHLPWVNTLCRYSRSIKCDPHICSTLIPLLFLLLKSEHAGLVTGHDVRSKLEACLDVLEADSEPVMASYGLRYIWTEYLTLNRSKHLANTEREDRILEESVVLRDFASPYVNQTALTAELWLDADPREPQWQYHDYQCGPALASQLLYRGVGRTGGTSIQQFNATASGAYPFTSIRVDANEST